MTHWGHGAWLPLFTEAALSPAAGGPAAPGRLDVLLHELPLDVVEVNVWRLLDARARAAVRQTCRGGRLLVDLHTTSVAFVLPITCELVMVPRCTFLGRLPRLTAMDLSAPGPGWNGVDHVAAAVLQFGAALKASAQNAAVASLTLSGPIFSAQSACGVYLAFPAICKLAVCATSMRLLRGPVFAPLHHLPQLQALAMHGNLSSTAMCSLAGLGSLRCLDVCVRNWVFAHDLRGWATGLTGLESCTLRVAVGDIVSDLVSVSSVFSLPCLTRLCLLHVVNRGDEADAWLHLGTCTRLRVLLLGDHVVLGDAAFAALRTLTSLATLGVGRVQLLEGQGQGQGQQQMLPALRCLGVHCSTCPSELLRTLTPLQPLALLTHLGSGAGPGPLSVLDLVAYGSTGTDTTVEAAALWRVSKLLARAPLLVLDSVVLAFAGHPDGHGGYGAGMAAAPVDSRVSLSVREVAEGLDPLGPRVHCMTWEGMPSVETGEDDLAALGAALPSLSALTLSGRALTDTWLVSLARHLPALTSLTILMGEGVTSVGWLALARACDRPLDLHVVPALSERLVALVHGEGRGLVRVHV